MANVQSGNMIVSLDIGTSKVVALVAEVTADQRLEVVGVGTHASTGLKKGLVVSVEKTVQAIQRAVEEAQQMAGCHIHSVFVGLSGNHIRGLNSHGVGVVRDREVSAADIERALEAARAVDLPEWQRVLHTLPRDYTVNSQSGIRDPLGMSGVRLEAQVHIVTCAIDAAQNIETCVRRAGLEVDEIILASLASAESVLTEDEKQLGVCLVDIGGGTTDIAVFANGAICHTAVLPVAGDQVTTDIALALHIPVQAAESIKVRYACALTGLVGDDEVLRIPSVGDSPARQVPRQALAAVVEPRYEELLLLVQAELRRSGYEKALAAGLVLTGGTARMEGTLELAEDIFQMPIRLGVPSHVGNSDVVDNPVYATGVGLLLCGLKRPSEPVFSNNTSEESKPPIFERLKRWVQSNL
ncbi:MAG: cell division protein FtsA [Pseudomonas sp.]